MSSSAGKTLQKWRFIDIAANLTDKMYRGVYNGSAKHESDLPMVLERAAECGVEKIVITGTDLGDSLDAVDLAKTRPNLYTTVGCHPTRCGEFVTAGEEDYFNSLLDAVQRNADKVVAIGEIGLDYDRLHFCDKETQKKYFQKQLSLGKGRNLPFFLHCRNAACDFMEILKDEKASWRGVVHSFTGTVEEMEQMLQLGLHIGINGCSLKTEENLKTVRAIPRDKLLLETDCPWCEIRPSHAAYKLVKTTFPSTKKEKYKSDCMVKGRNEPCTIKQVLEAVSVVRNEDADLLCECIWENTTTLFFPDTI